MRFKILFLCFVFFVMGCSEDEVEPPLNSGTGDLEVYVHFEDQPYPEALVTLVSEDKNMVSDSTGTVFFKDLKEGDYDLEIVLPFFPNSPYNASGTVLENQSVLVDVAVDISPPGPLAVPDSLIAIYPVLDAAYAHLPDIFGFDDYLYYWGDIGTDIVYMDPRNSATFPYNSLDRYVIASDDQVIHSVYTSHYRLIQRVNSGLDRLKNGEHAPLDESDKIGVEAEFRFLRAVGYFNLVKLFGSPPLVTTSNSNINDPSDFPQDANATYALIVEDLTFAKENLLESSMSTKASKGAAQALLGKVYMQMAGFPLLQTDKYAMALEEFKALDGIYTLQTEYVDVFKEDNTIVSGEVLFSVTVTDTQANTRSGYGSSWGPLGWAEVDGLSLAPGLLESYTNGEITFDETLTFPVAISDQRFENNIATFTFDGAVQETAEVDDWRPFKFLPKTELSVGAIDAKINFPYLRYADVLLLMAEAENEINGPTPLAYEAINTIRRRAFKNEQNDLPTGLSKQQFFDAVFKERKLELCYEGHRKDDLVRRQLLEQVLTDFNATDPEFEKDFQSHEYIWPIPLQEFDINTSLKQNPGY